MTSPRLSDEYERGYNALFICVIAGVVLNSICLCVAIYGLTEVGWPAWLSIGYCIGVYIVLYVANVIGKAVFICRDMLIDGYREKTRLASKAPQA